MSVIPNTASALHVATASNVVQLRLKQFSWCAAGIVTIFGATVISGWLFDVSYLRGAFAAGIQVKANTGICLVLCGLLLLLRLQSDGDGNIFFQRALSGAVLFLGAGTLSEYVFGWNIGIDELFFREALPGPATSSPNRMGPPAATSFALLGISFLALTDKRFQREDIASRLAIVVAVIALLPCLGYLFGAQELYGVARLTGIALSTALMLVLLAFGVIAACPNGKLGRLLCADDAGGVLARRLLPPALFLPPLFDYIRSVGERWGYYDATFGRSILITSFMLVFARLVWSSAQVLQATDKERIDLLDSERVARSNAERANRAKDEFLATLSHELRSPLNAILGWAQVIKRNKELPKDVGGGIEVIERNARLQAQLIEDLLDMSRMFSGKLRLELQPVELVDIIRAAVETALPEAEKKGLSLIDRFSGVSGNIVGDPARLQQIFWNLLSNAVKFTPNGGTITVSLKNQAGYLETSISDTGQGIDANFMSQIFDRFSQADSSSTRTFGGLGIGLSVVRELVHLQGGTVDASSPGKDGGATFVVRFPLVASSKQQTDGATVQPLQPMLDKIKVLVVDDDADARQLVGTILRERNATVVAAHSVEQALSLLLTESPNIIVSDISMPERDGFDLIKTLQTTADGQYRNIPAVALSALVRDEDKQKAIFSGYRAHLAKPVDARELVSVIAKLTRNANISSGVNQEVH